MSFETPEALKKKKVTLDLPRNLALHMTILIFSKGICRPSYPNAKATHTVRVRHMTTDEIFELPILNLDGALNLAGAGSYLNVAERLSRVGPEISEEQVRELLKPYPANLQNNLYWVTRWSLQNFADSKADSWTVTSDYKTAITVSLKKINAMLRKKGSKFRVVSRRIIYKEV